jgi:predicted RNA-binding Zn-ribbon protein involved in translation (DUF1610 family)
VEPVVGVILSLLMAAGVLASMLALKMRDRADVHPCPRCGMAMRRDETRCRVCGYDAP